MFIHGLQSENPISEREREGASIKSMQLNHSHNHSLSAVTVSHCFSVALIIKINNEEYISNGPSILLHLAPD